MPEPFHRIAALELGRYAKYALPTCIVGHVTAVFSSVFYVETVSHVFAVGHTEVDSSSVLMRLDLPPIDWRNTRLQPGDKVTYSLKILHVSTELKISTAGTRTWSPKLLNCLELEAALEGLECGTYAPPIEGYGSTAFSETTFPPELTLARQGLDRMFSTSDTDASHFVPLLGRGPGLTPSGDDLLGGMMIALHAMNHGHFAKLLWNALAPEAEIRTHPISRAMLVAASDGEGSAALHSAMNTFLSGRNLAPALEALSKIGHSSGWDAFAGVVLAARALAKRAKQPA